MSKPNPTYYAIIPATVRYDEYLTSTAKLLFGEITALANTQGFCSASNSYFAKLYGVTPRHISELVTSLVGQGHVQVEIDRAGGNKRKIRLAVPMEINPDSSPEKSEDPYGTKVPHNNTSNNNTNPTLSSDLEKHIKRAYNLYLDYFIRAEQGIEIMNRVEAAKRYRLTPKRRIALERRFKDSDSKMVFAAIVGYGRANWSNGHSDRGWKADLADFICRSYENIERGARLYEEQGKAPANDAWASLN